MCASGRVAHAIPAVSDSPTEVPFLLNNADDLPGIMIVSQATNLYVQPSRHNRGVPRLTKYSRLRYLPVHPKLISSMKNYCSVRIIFSVFSPKVVSI